MNTNIHNIFHAFARKLKENGECKLSGNTLFDRFAQAQGFKNKQAYLSKTKKTENCKITPLLKKANLYIQVDQNILTEDILCLSNEVYSLIENHLNHVYGDLINNNAHDYRTRLLAVASNIRDNKLTKEEGLLELDFDNKLDYHFSSKLSRFKLMSFLYFIEGGFITERLAQIRKKCPQDISIILESQLSGQVWMLFHEIEADLINSLLQNKHEDTNNITHIKNNISTITKECIDTYFTKALLISCAKSEHNEPF